MGNSIIVNSDISATYVSSESCAQRVLFGDSSSYIQYRKTAHLTSSPDNGRESSQNWAPKGLGGGVV